jgi:hypothetical protein
MVFQKDKKGEVKMLEKRVTVILLTIVMATLMPVHVFAATAVQAVPGNSSFILNGTNVGLEAYNINNNNYVKLRDLAKALNGGARQFEVTWDESRQAVEIQSNHAYTPVGGEMVSTGNPSIKKAVLSDSKVYIDGKEARLTAYRIDGNNYFRLRDIGASIGFAVVYDEMADAVLINSESITYENTQYGFQFTLPKSWENYTVITDEWKGNRMTDSQGNSVSETGPMLKIRNPLWTTQNQRQDIPIMIFTPAQWDDLQKAELIVGAAPMPPSELGRNAKYVFALPARYNYAFTEGFEEVESIIENKPLQPM